MDHLPVPQDRYLGSISIPFLASDEYTSPFHDYPHRNGWELSFPGDAQPRLQHTPTSIASRDLGALLQTWLYFGLLSEFLGERVDVNLFKRPHESGAFLVSTSLEKLVCDRTASLLDHAQLNGSDFLLSFQETFRLNIIMARYHVIFIMGTRTDPFDELSRICLSVTVLAEYLVTALFSLCRRCNIETPPRQNWRIVMTDASPDPGLLILKLMSQKGWCAYDIALLNGTEVQNVSTLYFLANLSPPKSDVLHSSCTPEKCLPMQVEKLEYLQAHTTTGCNCTSIGSNQTILAAIIRSGEIPLITLCEEEIEIKRCMRGTKFVTISHVWADGMGNPSENSLPVCIVHQLQQLVDSVHKSAGTPFWIDTLCIPRGPPDLKTEALLRMREPYERATHVLVMDSYLRKFEANQASLLDLLARIAVCGWSQRLWTFQEGRLPQDPARVVFAFKDKIVDLFEELNITFPHFPTLASQTIQREILYGHKQTAFTGPSGLGLPDEYVRFSMPSIREALRRRQTSRAADEALCIGGGIFNLPNSELRDIIQANAELRMVKIWQKVKTIPTGIVFSKVPHKLRTKGYRWAPASFMGNLSMSLYDWEGPNATFTAGDAALMVSGLAVKLSGWRPGVGDASCQKALMRLCDMKATSSVKSILLVDEEHGRWFKCTLGSQWNDSPEDTTPTEHLIFINDGTPDYLSLQERHIRSQSEFESQGYMKGLLASCGKDHEEDHTLLTVHRHVEYQLESVRVHEVNSLLKVCADNICRDHSEALTIVREDENRLHELVSGITKQFLKNMPEILAKKRAINQHNGWGNSADLATDDCILFVQSLVAFGPCCVVSESSQTNWCVT
jgi:hypothetical protein